jgi:YbbR domain-containing protein
MSNKPFLERVLEHWPAKILSLMTAILLFAFYQLNRLEERPLAVPLRVTRNEDLAPSSPYPRTVRLVLKGESNSIFAVQEEDLEAVLDLSNFHAEGVYRVPVTIEKKGSAVGIDPLEIRVDPSDVAVALEQRLQRSVPIVPSFRGFLDPGYELASSELTPQTAEIEGPASLVRKAVDVTTEFIELSGRSEDFTTTVRLQRRDPLLSFSGSESVEFHATVQKALAYRSFEGLSIKVEHLAEGLALSGDLPAGTLRIVGSRNDLSFVAPSEDVLYVDMSSILDPGIYTVPVGVRVPEGINAEAWTPAAVTLSVVRSSEAKR